MMKKKIIMIVILIVSYYVYQYERLPFIGTGQVRKN